MRVLTPILPLIPHYRTPRPGRVLRFAPSREQATSMLGSKVLNLARTNALARWHQYYSPDDDPTRYKLVDIRDLLEGHSWVVIPEKVLRPSNKTVDVYVCGLVRWVGIVHHQQLVGVEIATRKYGANNGFFEGVQYFTIPNFEKSGHSAVFLDPKHLRWPTSRDLTPRLARIAMDLTAQPRPGWIYLSWKYRVQMVMHMLRIQRRLQYLQRPCVFVWGQNNDSELSLDTQNSIVRFPELLQDPKSVARRVALICPSHQHTVVLTTGGRVYTCGASLTNLLGHSSKGKFYRLVTPLDPHASHRDLYEDVAALRASLQGMSGNGDDSGAAQAEDLLQSRDGQELPRFDTWKSVSPMKTPQSRSAVPVDAQAASASSFKFPNQENQPESQPPRLYKVGSIRQSQSSKIQSPAGSKTPRLSTGSTTQTPGRASNPSPATATLDSTLRLTDGTGFTLPRIKFKSDRVLTVAAGGMHTVAMLESGRVVTWGGSLYGKLGTNDASAAYEAEDMATSGEGSLEDRAVVGTPEAGVPHTVWAGVPGVRAKRTTATEALLALLSDDPDGRTAGVLEHVAAGSGEDKKEADHAAKFQLRYALPGLDGRAGIPQGFNVVSLRAGKQACSVACGQTFTVICTTDGDVYTFGGSKDHVYVLGHGQGSSPVSTPTPVNTQGHKIVHVVCGAYHTLALTSDRRVMAWGKNDYGQLGLGKYTNVYTPELLTALYEDADRNGLVHPGTGSLHTREVLQIAAGGYHSLMILLPPGEKYNPDVDIGLERQLNRRRSLEELLDQRQSGSLYSFGCDVNGQLGHGHTGGLMLPGLTNDELYQPQASVPDTPLSLSGALRASACPRQVVNLYEPIVQAAAGLRHSLALTISGKVYSWGSAAYGQLGDGQFKSVSTPVWVSALRHFRIAHIAAGGNHSTASTRPFRNLMQMRESYRIAEKRRARRLSQDLGIADVLLSDSELRRMTKHQRDLDEARARRRGSIPDLPAFDDLSDYSDEEVEDYYDAVAYGSVDVDADEENDSDAEGDAVSVADSKVTTATSHPDQSISEALLNAEELLLKHNDTLDGVYSLLSRVPNRGTAIDFDSHDDATSKIFADGQALPPTLPPSVLFKVPRDIISFVRDVLRLDIHVTHTQVSSSIQRMVTFQTFQPVEKLQRSLNRFSRDFLKRFDARAENVTFRAGCVTATIGAARAGGKPLGALATLKAGSGGSVLNGIRGINAGSPSEQTTVVRQSDIARLGLSEQDLARLRALKVVDGGESGSSSEFSREPISSQGLTQCTYLSTHGIGAATRSTIQAINELQRRSRDGSESFDDAATVESVRSHIVSLNEETAAWAYEFVRTVVYVARNSDEDRSKMNPLLAGMRPPVWQRVSICEIRPTPLSVYAKRPGETANSAAASVGGSESPIIDPSIIPSIETRQRLPSSVIVDEELADCLYLSPTAQRARQ